MKKTIFILINLIVIAMLLGGCTLLGKLPAFEKYSVFESRLEKDFGNSHRLAIANQTLDPGAEKNLEPVYGNDGNTVDITINAFQKGFETRGSAPKFPLDTIALDAGN